MIAKSGSNLSLEPDATIFKQSSTFTSGCKFSQLNFKVIAQGIHKILRNPEM